jgi:hypothetical protein
LLDSVLDYKRTQRGGNDRDNAFSVSIKGHRSLLASLPVGAIISR